MPMRTALFPADFKMLDDIREFVGQAARDAGLSDKPIYGVQMAVDEACSNIIEHAYEGISGGQIEITCNLHADGLTVILRDHGRTFDPGKVSAPDLDASLEDREIGGLGVFLMRKLMDEVHFESIPEAGNVLTMVKRKEGR